MGEFITGLLGEIWRIFTSLTYPGLSITFADIIVGLGVLAVAFRLFSNYIGHVSEAPRREKYGNSYAAYKKRRDNEAAAAKREERYKKMYANEGRKF